MKNYREILIPLVIRAGDEILKYYGKDYITEYKSDNSPVTIADISANNIIVEGLKSTNLEIISEELDFIDYNKRKNLTDYWLVDPLDGTKQFVNNENEFTVNIALIKNKIPVEGIVYAPALGKLYYGNIDDGAFVYDYNDRFVKMQKLPLKTTFGFRIIASKSHINIETEQFLSDIKTHIPNSHIFNVGSSLKFCSVAEGKTHIYPRMDSISEWDIAAGHAVLRSAGGFVIDIDTKREVVYNTEHLKTPKFIAFLEKDKFEKINKVVKS